MTGDNLLDQPEILLPAEPEVLEALSRSGRREIADVAQAHPTSSLAWAQLADVANAEGRQIESYAYARVGYHRGLDALRKAGWRGHGSIPWSHEPNQGVLRALYALQRAAREIGETDEVGRLTAFLAEADPNAIARIESEHTTTQLIQVIRPAPAVELVETIETPTPESPTLDNATTASADPASPPTEVFVIRGED